MANFDSEFFGLVFPGFQATPKIHAQNSRPELSAFLSNFTFLNPKFIHGDFLLTGEGQNFCGKKVPRKILQENPRQNPPNFIQQKSSNTFLQIAQGKLFLPHNSLYLSPLLSLSLFLFSLLSLSLSLSLSAFLPPSISLRGHRLSFFL